MKGEYIGHRHKIDIFIVGLINNPTCGCNNKEEMDFHFLFSR